MSTTVRNIFEMLSEMAVEREINGITFNWQESPSLKKKAEETIGQQRSTDGVTVVRSKEKSDLYLPTPKAQCWRLSSGHTGWTNLRRELIFSCLSSALGNFTEEIKSLKVFLYWRQGREVGLAGVGRKCRQL